MGFPYQKRPLNFGHRGMPESAPENTLASFQAACTAGADGIEFDVMLSADGELVVIHDFTVDRTTNGHGRVCQLTLTQLKALDAGSWLSQEFVGERIPTLREAIEWAGHDVLLNIELKDWTLDANGLEQKVIAMVHQYRLVDRVLLSSFNPLRIWRVRRLDPNLHTGLIYAPNLSIFLRRGWLRLLARPDALHPHLEMATDAHLRWARNQGYRVNVWTPDTERRMQHLISQKVDMIITNRPDVLAEVLKQEWSALSVGVGHNGEETPPFG